MLLTKITIHPPNVTFVNFCFNEDFKIHALGTNLTLLTEVHDGDEKKFNNGYIKFSCSDW